MLALMVSRPLVDASNTGIAIRILTGKVTAVAETMIDGAIGSHSHVKLHPVGLAKVAGAGDTEADARIGVHENTLLQRPLYKREERTEKRMAAKQTA